ncbi:SpoIIE family protein phosphatase [Streptantibioticus cattleyicolor]|uniref:protein-serine/threonine phosphatase n=1 Tax=Streptantibioticus cattleyicolor (strain ATCC 35852 / DSM 46488 / JCM 4925 / NBRC 14057 / NRRL 8057) TaxID=1003195 RepID=F8JMY1_STREN|nr:SpoIIE family protein phosphatase [Streptantibioticus cattleyicolor]AEW98600.1 magnesium or manganese-dependent protein phosphatase [Streptantibioticus cattleyicolor NRRL 8057 = DSM 46488]CCB72341.1 conserved protein of unknown function [Streptantibioticus cattleyicolor NRRL 8057 = DSM 46488]
MTGDPGQSDDAALDEALAATVRRTGAWAGGVYVLSPDEPTLELVVMSGLPEAASTPWWRVPVSGSGPVSESVREDRLVWVGSQEDMVRRYPRTAAAMPYRLALAATPIRDAQRCRGTLLLLWPATHPPTLTRRERGRVTSSARRLGQVLDESVRPPAPSPSGRPRVITVHPSGTGADRSGLAAADLLERLPLGAIALDLEGRVTFVNAAAAGLLGSSPGQLLGTQPWHSLPWLDDPVYEEHYRTAVLSREPVGYHVLRPPDRWLDFRLYPDDSGISALITPHGEPVGPPDPAARQAHPHPHSAAMSPAGPGRIHQLMHLAAALTETVGVRDVVDLVADQIVPAFGAQGMVVSIADAGRLRIAGYLDYPSHLIERLDGLPLGTGVTPVGEVMATGVPAFFGSREELARDHPRAVSLSDKQAWAFLPLTVSGRSVGCCVLSYRAPHRFTADERAVLTPLAALVAQALDRARLYDAKHDLAHGLQQALLPRALPDVTALEVAARYLPATHGMDIGGDFYDLIRLGDTTAAAIIGDVQGHNVTAAAVMGQVRTAVHAHATAGESPDQVLACTNRVLADFRTDLFVSCLYAHLDLAGRRVSLASAGHPAPLLRSPGPPPHTRVLDVEPGLPLGIGIDTPYPVTTASLPPGAVLALYTDGLVETRGRDLTETTEAVARHLTDTGDRPLDQLIDGLIRHTWPTGQHTDDIAVLLLRTRTA